SKLPGNTVVLREEETTVFSALLRAFPVFVLVLTAVVWPVESNAAQLTLTWTDNSTNEDGFAIERKTGTTGTYAQIATVGPRVTSDTGSAFSGGSRCGCRGSASCAVRMNAATTVIASSAAPTFALAVTRAGTGSGTVTSTPAGIICGTSC